LDTRCRGQHYSINEFILRVFALFAARKWNLRGRCDDFRYLSFISSSLNASVGVRHPGHFLGVPFKRSQIDFISRFESAAMDASRGRYLRARLFKLSIGPFCQGACGSQNQASVPIPGFSLRQFRTSMLRSKVMDLRAWLGKGLHHAHQLVHQKRRAAVVVAEQDSKACLALDREARFVLTWARSKSFNHRPIRRTSHVS
jgi:hypothetical protein